MGLSAAFRCIRGCQPQRHSLDSLVIRCPNCDGLLEVEHDMSALAETSGAEWRQRFEARWASAGGPMASGVWGKREWVAPHIDSEHIVTAGEGRTHLQPVPRLADQLGLGSLWIKHCGVSHTGSFKDLGMTVLVSAVSQMIARGNKIPAVACASTGDTSAALAAYAAMAGIPSVVILPRGKISTAQLVQPLACGATVVAVDTDFDGCMRYVTRLALEEGLYLANSMNSLRIEGQKTVGIEIAQQLDWQPPDWIVIPGGNLGNVSALAAGLTMARELGVIDRVPRLCVAQAERANPLYRSFQTGFESFEPVAAQPTLASAIQIGDPVSRDKAIAALRAFDGVVEQASEQELSDAAAQADRHGLFCCPHTGVALAAVAKLAAGGVIGSSETAVVVSTASGLKFSEFKIGYHAGTGGDGEASAIATPHRNQPVEVDDSYEQVRRAALSAGRA